MRCCMKTWLGVILLFEIVTLAALYLIFAASFMQGHGPW